MIGVVFLLVGMYWCNFCPNSMTSGRKVQFRLTLPVSKTTDVVLALEDPVSFLTLPDESGFKALKANS